jgi:hypothetical protein
MTLARIRSLKPQFFKNEDLAVLSPWHRLAFGGLWCHADREGRLEDRPKRLKAEIFPYDDLDLDAILWDLHDAGFIVRYVADGQNCIGIPTWKKHQVPRKDEHESNLPAFSDLDTQRRRRNGTVAVPPLDSDGTVVVQCVGNREVGNREVGGGELPALDARPAPRRADDLQELWNTTTTHPIPRCRELTPARRKKIAARLSERPIEQWAEVAARIEASAFCRGKNDRGWKATFDWLIDNAENAVKVLEGKYDGSRPMLVRGQVEPQPEYRSADYECHHTPRCGSARIHENALAMGRLEVPA